MRAKIQGMHLVDTHAHIYHDNFEDKQAVVQAATRAGVSKVLMPNIDLASISAMHQLAEDYPELCYSMMGLHPCHVEHNYKDVLLEMRALHDRYDYVAVGEIGIDLFWDPSSRERQEDAFRQQIGWAKDLNLPIVIHSREALDLTISIVQELQDGSLTGVFHCFNGTVDQGKRIIEVGFYMGIGGVLTYKKAGIDKSVADLPLEAMVLETDSPYLTPVRYRKKGVDNEPAYLHAVAERLAKVKDVDLDYVAKVTSANAEVLFPSAFNKPLLT